MSYKLRLDVFEGPLDLLLYLIKKNDIDIKDIPIVKVTEQYMEYIEMMKLLDLEIVGDFLVMAATLIQIKSKMLLPPDPSAEEEDEIDPRDELARRLLEYKRFKEIAETLESHELQRKDYYTRRLDDDQMQQIKDDAREVFFEASLFDLITAFQEALQRTPEEIIHEIIQEEFTVEDKIHDILHELIQQEKMSVKAIFKRCRSRSEIVVSFIAVLELIRLREIKAYQAAPFDDIQIVRNQGSKDRDQPPAEPGPPDPQ
ncbi:MAG: segregation/condensation protein A [Candidatus Omnitrophica bacterium]|nr:segregation/condensation protein A [Candidatus Omnitrophota bacterium]MCB9721309.1 segregation/condensation protein A [Candidatus Omnitrophota bacterium]